MDRHQLSAQQIIEHLELTKHPEGGYYKEVYRSDELLENLPSRFSAARNIATSIYFMLNKKDKSHFHRIKSDETWHFYKGSSVIIHIIYENGNYSKVTVGNSIMNGELFQYTIPRYAWFAAELVNKEGFGLFGCTVSPGFDFQDFELASADSLVKNCQSQRELIENFCLK